jgi:beta-glucosidase
MLYAADVVVEFDVTNTGERTSRETVQLYFDPAGHDQPVRLIGWAAAVVSPGQTAAVRISSDARLWRRWDAETGAWTALPRTGRLLIARGLGDIRSSITL